MVTHYDRTELIHRTLHTVRKNMIEGIGLVVLVLVLFLGLGNYRTALVVALAVPVSLLGAYLLLDLRGIPANLISMGAIDFGIIVDSAVVIAENLIRILHERKDKPNPSRARLCEAVREMGRPILFSKAILLTAFIPVYTLQRVEGRIFRPMALTLTYALITGTIFAVFVVPPLLSFAVRHGTQEDDSWIVRKLIQLYRPVLNFALSCRKLVFAGAGAAARLRRRWPTASSAPSSCPSWTRAPSGSASSCPSPFPPPRPPTSSAMSATASPRFRRPRTCSASLAARMTAPTSTASMSASST